MVLVFFDLNGPKHSIGLLSVFVVSQGTMTSLRLWVQGDNTPKELRNQSTAAMMASFCQAGLFETCSHCHLGVGHTHEDVDGCLALVTTALGSEPDIQTPADVMRILRQKLGPLFHRNNMEFGVELVDTAN